MKTAFQQVIQFILSLWRTVRTLVENKLIGKLSTVEMESQEVHQTVGDNCNVSADISTNSTTFIISWNYVCSLNDQNTIDMNKIKEELNNMTQNQIAYWNLQETKRHNQAQEAENVRVTDINTRDKNRELDIKDREADIKDKDVESQIERRSSQNFRDSVSNVTDVIKSGVDVGKYISGLFGGK